MVLVIAAIVVAGVTAAFALRVDNGDGLGSQYRIQKLKDNAVITPAKRIMSAPSLLCATRFWTISAS